MSAEIMVIATGVEPLMGISAEMLSKGQSSTHGQSHESHPISHMKDIHMVEMNPRRQGTQIFEQNHKNVHQQGMLQENSSLSKNEPTVGHDTLKKDNAPEMISPTSVSDHLTDYDDWSNIFQTDPTAEEWKIHSTPARASSPNDTLLQTALNTVTDPLAVAIAEQQHYDSSAATTSGVTVSGMDEHNKAGDTVANWKRLSLLVPSASVFSSCSSSVGSCSTAASSSSLPSPSIMSAPRSPINQLASNERTNGPAATSGTAINYANYQRSSMTHHSVKAPSIQLSSANRTSVQNAIHS